MTIQILHEGTDWEMLQFKTKFDEWTINRIDDTVFIECGNNDNNSILILNQDELKTLIAFLQRQVK